jgi:hypothetical protein
MDHCSHAYFHISPESKPQNKGSSKY